MTYLKRRADSKLSGDDFKANTDMNSLAFKEFLISLAVALVLCVIVALVTRRKARRTGFGWFFLLVLMATWAGGSWIRPFGPAFGDIRWILGKF